MHILLDTLVLIKSCTPSESRHRAPSCSSSSRPGVCSLRSGATRTPQLGAGAPLRLHPIPYRAARGPVRGAAGTYNRLKKRRPGSQTPNRTATNPPTVYRPGRRPATAAQIHQGFMYMNASVPYRPRNHLLRGFANCWLKLKPHAQASEVWR